ncbi:hypothetical protein [uncultured Winogradskyella sp.]|uniref:hypothetical protein n=1 Tax=uncultured Winogradskyella sp. TaxID=395353 RepID=UPI0026229C12|nr:hypothetical protein [uncultured Winogradskyella sp.]
MTYSQITLIFDTDLAINESILFDATINNGFTFQEIWVSLRTGVGKVTQGTPTNIDGERSAINFVTAFNLDFNNSNIYEVTRTYNTVVIASTIANNDFDNFSNIADVTANPTTESTNVRAIIDNFDGDVLTIDSYSIIQATENGACSHYRFQVNTSIQADEYYFFNDSENSVTVNNNPFFFEIQRSIGFSITVVKDEQIQFLTLLPDVIPSLWNSANINVISNYSPNGGTVTINLNNVNNVGTIEYSLDNSNWQTSNTFSGLVADDYTIYVRDGLGCFHSLDFTVDSNNITEPYSKISKSNSIRFAVQESFEPCSASVNDENTLSYQAFARNQRLAYKESWKFNSCDIVPNQIWSNYANIAIQVLKADGNTDVIIPTQLTYNIGRTDARDAMAYGLENDKTGIYFLTGNLYDFDTNLDTGNDYTLNGGLPEWGVIGNYMHYNNAWYQIENVFYDDDLQAEVLAINTLFTQLTATSSIVKCQYNRQNFEVYEFNVAMAAYNNTCIQVQIVETDSRFPTKTRLSEFISVKTEHKDCIKMISYSVDNTDVYYQSGIQHIAHLPIINIEGGYDQESEINKGDNASGLISGSLYETNLFIIGPVTKEHYRQIVEQASNEIVIINGTYYVKNGNVEKDGPLEESNLYEVRLNMLKSKGRGTLNASDELLNTNENLEVPNLVIDSDGNVVSYQQ